MPNGVCSRRIEMDYICLVYVDENRLASLPTFDMLGASRAVQSANYFRMLRKKGITIRKTADVIIAGFCIENGFPLLYSDRDFDPFVQHFGLREALRQ